MSIPRAFVHDRALIDEGVSLGDGCRVGAFARVEQGAVVGSETTVGDHCLVARGATLGANVTVMAGARVLDSTRVEDGVVIGPNAVVGVSTHGAERPAIVRSLAQVLSNAVVDAGVTIGTGARVMPNAHVTQSVPATAIVAGAPAAIEGYVDAIAPGQAAIRVSRIEPARHVLPVNRAALLPVATVEDLRGRIAVTEFGDDLPFQPRRVFFVTNVPNRNVRGEHAHRTLEQFLICVSGESHVLVDDGSTRVEVILDAPSMGLHLPPMTWSVQYKHAPGTVMAVLASDRYDPADYIRDYDEFLALCGLARRRT